MRTPNHVGDDTINGLIDRAMLPSPRLAPEQPFGTPIYFADEIPIAWLLNHLAAAGLVTTRWISDGKLHAVLSAEAQADIARQIEADRPRREHLERYPE
jgi:hypothetical protein